MDLNGTLKALHADKWSLALYAALAGVTLALLKFLFRSTTEDAIDFSVPVPEQCRPGWKGKQLQEPTIKVCMQRGTLIGTRVGKVEIWAP